MVHRNLREQLFNQFHGVRVNGGDLELSLGYRAHGPSITLLQIHTNYYVQCVKRGWCSDTRVQSDVRHAQIDDACMYVFVTICICAYVHSLQAATQAEFCALCSYLHRLTWSAFLFKRQAQARSIRFFAGTSLLQWIQRSNFNFKISELRNLLILIDFNAQVVNQN